MRVTRDDHALARRWAGFYRERGFNPLPSRMDEKRPLVRFAEYWDEPAPAGLFDRMPTTNVQVMTGRRWRLLAIDLDGPEARGWFEGLGPVPPTWATHSGGGGVHLWFRLPPGLGRELPRAVLWRGEGRHAAVERLCDRSLIVAPPSIHPATGRRYRFLGPSHSPKVLPLPAPCPGWILSLRPVDAPRRAPRPPRDFSRTLEAIPDKVALARSWGLRPATDRPNARGWIPCHAVGREDRTPSASISAETGRYWEPGLGTVSLCDLGVMLGAYPDRRSALSDLDARFGIRGTTR